MTSETDDLSYFTQLVDHSKTPAQSPEDLNKSIMEAIQELNNAKNKGETKRVVKFAGENIEYSYYVNSNLIGLQEARIVPSHLIHW